MLDPTFLYYLVCAPGFQASLYGVKTHGSMVADYVSISQQLEFQISLPPIAEQRRIAGILDALDEKIELSRRIAETVETTVLALSVEMLWSAETPTCELSDVAVLARDLVDPSAHPDVVFAHYSLPAFDNGRRPVRERGSAIRSVKIAVPPDAVLLSKLNPEIERVWYPDVRPPQRAICSTEFLVLQPLKSVGRPYLYALFRSEPFRREVESLVTGTSNSHQRAPASAVMSLSVARPHPWRLAKFNAAASPLLDRSSSARREVESLSAIRDVLLPRLLAGQALQADPSLALAHP